MAVRFTPGAAQRGIVALLLAAALTTTAAAIDGRPDTGWNALLAELGPNMPDGANIRVMQVEAPQSGAYLPFVNPGAGEYLGKTIVDQTGGNLASSHANVVGRTWFGNTLGYAPGITIIEGYEAGDYLNTVIQWNGTGNATRLNLGSVRIVNNSWISTTTGTPANRATRRTDYQTDVNGVIYVNGVNNGSATSVPPILASSYNGIAVGLSNGGSSLGPTVFDGSRCKPDIVAPEGVVSFAAPQVAGAVAMLLDQAQTHALVEGERPQVIKAILQAGAEKLAGWQKGAPGAADDVTRPLDFRQGAGELQVDRNYVIMAAGRQPPSSSALRPRRAWAYEGIQDGQAHDQLVQIGTGNTTLAASLTWHRHHGGNFSTDAMLALNNLALELWETDAQWQPATLIQESRSLVDNVQHIYATALPHGIYLLRVTRSTAGAPATEPYGLAWWSDGVITPGDLNGDGLVDFFDIDPLLLALFDPAAYDSQNPGLDADLWGDMDGSGTLDFFDIDPFIDALFGGP